MDIDNKLCTDHVSLQKFHVLLGQNLPSLSRIQVNTVQVVDHLGRILPVPIQFCSTWKVFLLSAIRSANGLATCQDFDYIINGYCKGHFGSRFVQRGDYIVICSKDGQIIDRSAFPKAANSGIILELSILIRQKTPFQDNMQKCPRCGYFNSSATIYNDWIEWQVPFIYLFIYNLAN